MCVVDLWCGFVSWFCVHGLVFQGGNFWWCFEVGNNIIVALFLVGVFCCWSLEINDVVKVKCILI